MNVGIGTEAAQFLFWECINLNIFAVFSLVIPFKAVKLEISDKKLLGSLCDIFAAQFLFWECINRNFFAVFSLVTPFKVIKLEMSDKEILGSLCDIFALLSFIVFVCMQEIPRVKKKLFKFFIIITI
jgi:hypothetical protein